MAVKRPRGASTRRLEDMKGELAHVERQLSETVAAVAALRERIDLVLRSDLHHVRAQALMLNLEGILGPRSPLTVTERGLLRRLLAVFHNNPKVAGFGP